MCGCVRVFRTTTVRLIYSYALYKIYDCASCSEPFGNIWPWIGCWTQDQKVWGSIPSAGHVQKCQANFVFPTASVGQAIMGTWCPDPRLYQ